MKGYVPYVNEDPREDMPNDNQHFELSEEEKKKNMTMYYPPQMQMVQKKERQRFVRTPNPPPTSPQFDQIFSHNNNGVSPSEYLSSPDSGKENRGQIPQDSFYMDHANSNNFQGIHDVPGDSIYDYNGNMINMRVRDVSSPSPRGYQDIGSPNFNSTQDTGKKRKRGRPKGRGRKRKMDGIPNMETKRKRRGRSAGPRFAIIDGHKKFPRCRTYNKPPRKRKYFGVHWKSDCRIWRAEMKHEGIRYNGGSFPEDEQLEAAMAVNAICEDLGIPFKNPGLPSRKYVPLKSIYKGVVWDRPMKMWRAAFKHNQKMVHLGFYKDELRAAKAVNWKCMGFGISLKNPDLGEICSFPNPDIAPPKYTCVHWNITNKRWQAGFRYLTKYHHIGLFDDELEAAQAVNHYCQEFGIPFKNPGVAPKKPPNCPLDLHCVPSHRYVYSSSSESDEDYSGTPSPRTKHYSGRGKPPTSSSRRRRAKYEIPYKHPHYFHHHHHQTHPHGMPMPHSPGHQNPMMGNQNLDNRGSVFHHPPPLPIMSNISPRNSDLSIPIVKRENSSDNLSPYAPLMFPYPQMLPNQQNENVATPKEPDSGGFTYFGEDQAPKVKLERNSEPAAPVPGNLNPEEGGEMNDLKTSVLEHIKLAQEKHSLEQKVGLDHELSKKAKEEFDTSKYQGVHFDPVRRGWIASFQDHGILHEVGCYPNPQTAALAVNLRCKDLGIPVKNPEFNDPELMQMLRKEMAEKITRRKAADVPVSPAPVENSTSTLVPEEKADPTQRKRKLSLSLGEDENGVQQGENQQPPRKVHKPNSAPTPSTQPPIIHPAGTALSSSFRSIIYDRTHEGWTGFVQAGNETHHIGYFSHELDCALALNQKCKECGVPLKNPQLAYLGLHHLNNPAISAIQPKPHTTATPANSSVSSSPSPSFSPAPASARYFGASAGVAPKTGQRVSGPVSREQLDAWLNVQLGRQVVPSVKGERMVDGVNIVAHPKYKCVHWMKAVQKWMATITVNRKSHFIGVFEDPFIAAMAVNLKCLEMGVPVKNPDVPSNVPDLRYAISHSRTLGSTPTGEIGLGNLMSSHVSNNSKMSKLGSHYSRVYNDTTNLFQSPRQADVSNRYFMATLNSPTSMSPASSLYSAQVQAPPTQSNVMRKQTSNIQNNYTFLIEAQDKNHCIVGSCIYATHWGGKVFLLTAASCVTYKENEQVKMFQSMRLRVAVPGPVKAFKTMTIDPKDIRIYPSYYFNAGSSDSQNSNLALIIVNSTQSRIFKNHAAPINLGNGDEFQTKYLENMNYFFVSGFHLTDLRAPMEVYTSSLTSPSKIGVKYFENGDGVLEYSNPTSKGQIGGPIVFNFRNGAEIGEHLIGIHLATNVGEKNGVAVHHGMLLTNRKVMWIRNMLFDITLPEKAEATEDMPLATALNNPEALVKKQETPKEKSTTNDTSKYSSIQLLAAHCVNLRRKEKEKQASTKPEAEETVPKVSPTISASLPPLPASLPPHPTASQSRSSTPEPKRKSTATSRKQKPIVRPGESKVLEFENDASSAKVQSDQPNESTNVDDIQASNGSTPSTPELSDASADVKKITNAPEKVEPEKMEIVKDDVEVNNMESKSVFEEQSEEKLKTVNDESPENKKDSNSKSSNDKVNISSIPTQNTANEDQEQKPDIAIVPKKEESETAIKIENREKVKPTPTHLALPLFTKTMVNSNTNKQNKRLSLNSTPTKVENADEDEETSSEVDNRNASGSESGNLKQKRSQYKGVSWCDERNQWSAQLLHKDKVYLCGRFKEHEEILAARAVNSMCRNLALPIQNPAAELADSQKPYDLIKQNSIEEANPIPLIDPTATILSSHQSSYNAWDQSDTLSLLPPPPQAQIPTISENSTSPTNVNASNFPVHLYPHTASNNNFLHKQQQSYQAANSPSMPSPNSPFLQSSPNHPFHYSNATFGGHSDGMIDNRQTQLGDRYRNNLSNHLLSPQTPKSSPLMNLPPDAKKHYEQLLFMQQLRESENLASSIPLTQHQIPGSGVRVRKSKLTEPNDRKLYPSLNKVNDITSPKRRHPMLKESRSTRKRGRPGGRRKRKAEKPKIPARGGCGLSGQEIKVWACPWCSTYNVMSETKCSCCKMEPPISPPTPVNTSKLPNKPPPSNKSILASVKIKVERGTPKKNEKIKKIVPPPSTTRPRSSSTVVKNTVKNNGNKLIPNFQPKIIAKKLVKREKTKQTLVQPVVGQKRKRVETEKKKQKVKKERSERSRKNVILSEIFQPDALSSDDEKPIQLKRRRRKKAVSTVPLKTDKHQIQSLQKRTTVVEKKVVKEVKKSNVSERPFNDSLSLKTHQKSQVRFTATNRFPAPKTSP